MEGKASNCNLPHESQHDSPTLAQLQKENQELRARLAKAEKIVRTVGQMKGMLKTLFGQLNETNLKV